MNKNNKIIWMSWLQGLCDPHIPKLNLDCINRWKDLNPDWRVEFITYKNVSKYAPEFQHIIDKRPGRKKAHQTDLLKLLLLEKFGGVWCDASLYPTLPMSNFIDDILNNTGFFTYRFLPRSIDQKMGNRDTVVWFFAVNEGGHYLISKWRQLFLKKFIGSQNFKYFTMAESLCELYDQDKKIQFIIDNMVQIHEKIPHSAIQDWNFRKESYMYKRPNIK